MKKQIIIEIISLLLIILFVYSAVNKLMDVEKFQVQIGKSPLLTHISWLVAWCVPFIEIVISILLAIPRFRLTGLFGAFSLMTIFTTYIIIILNFSDHVPCACGGVLEKLGWTEHLIFNIVFMALSLTATILLYSKIEYEHLKDKDRVIST
jgi:uncharacterized membrane protein YphA (DoxX/SURF4 family)